jgi:hypothetical protein
MASFSSGPNSIHEAAQGSPKLRRVQQTLLGRLSVCTQE